MRFASWTIPFDFWGNEIQRMHCMCRREIIIVFRRILIISLCHMYSWPLRKLSRCNYVQQLFIRVIPVDSRVNKLFALPRRFIFITIWIKGLHELSRGYFSRKYGFSELCLMSKWKLCEYNRFLLVELFELQRWLLFECCCKFMFNLRARNISSQFEIIKLFKLFSW